LGLALPELELELLERGLQVQELPVRPHFQQ
jgi:hypothetical protein